MKCQHKILRAIPFKWQQKFSGQFHLNGNKFSGLFHLNIHGTMGRQLLNYPNTQVHYDNLILLETTAH